MAELDFVFFGERPCLDFANTLRRRKDARTPTTDLLSERGVSRWFSAALGKAKWAREMPDVDPISDAELTSKALTLRNLVIALAENTLSITPERECEPMDLNLFAQGDAITYQVGKDGLLVPTATPAAILTFVANDAMKLFTNPAAQRIKMCAHERCGMLYEDQSNGLRRQWCSMKECGNRAKVARHAASASS